MGFTLLPLFNSPESRLGIALPPFLPTNDIAPPLVARGGPAGFDFGDVSILWDQMGGTTLLWEVWGPEQSFLSVV